MISNLKYAIGQLPVKWKLFSIAIILIGCLLGLYKVTDSTQLNNLTELVLQLGAILVDEVARPSLPVSPLTEIG